ncbi:DUF413 domain-containing protein [Shewanella fodinae]|uniref:Macrodomain Ori protein n=1 Tax=Shewanella fodinae TaxID=552357 RepID=A0A4R2FL80_9GAMM|nr:DUF413 domain-containing protein [Shewanella fodinae]MCL2905146.1 DUF413 domain-containing protein [Shewanella fodinae]MDN5370310.1 uncharacterized protein [Shewanella sp.]TCN90118.1 hypothetical protein EDC91_10227 [Shewanella fodinae]GGY88207.1 hypothetical protein GCM10007169_01780 [Shewanella fodinae]
MLTTTSSSSSVPQNNAVSFSSTRRFYDDANFPKGFRRCGDFTQKEAELLEAHGVAMKSLADGSLLPRTIDEQRFVDVVKGLQAASSPMEKLWIKYTTLAQGRPFYAVVGTNLVRPSEADVYLDLLDTDSDVADEDEEPQAEEKA